MNGDLTNSNNRDKKKIIKLIYIVLKYITYITMNLYAAKRYVNKRYDPSLLKDLYREFEKKIGRDVSKYIIDFIEIDKNQKCRICEDKIGQKYSCCIKKECRNIICDECYDITSRFNDGKPYCDIHFTHHKYVQRKYIKNKNKHFKRQLIKKMKRKIKKHNINRIHYLYKNKYNQRIINEFYKFSKYKQFFKVPRRTHIRCNSYMEIRYNTLHVIFVDNIHDSFYYDFF